MSSDFWAGYLSGAASIAVGNPLDLLKVRIQASASSSASVASSTAVLRSARSYIAGLPAPVLAYGALNGILFASYNRCLAVLTPTGTTPSWPAHFVAGNVAGLATFVVSAPSEYVKCRAQLAEARRVEAPTHSAVSSWAIAARTLRQQGIAGLYVGGAVTSIRDAVGYGFYFVAYEASKDAWTRCAPDAAASSEAAKTLVCGGVAGVATWTSVFPLDVVKTRVQTQSLDASSARGDWQGAWQLARQMYLVEGPSVFWKGLGVCNLRAFVVNAVQWSVYEWAMRRLGGTALLAHES